MLKILAILALLYFFFRSVGHVVRMIFGSTVSSRSQNPYANQQSKRTTRDGLHVDSSPKGPKSRKADFKGGDYVDYEEVD